MFSAMVVSRLLVNSLYGMGLKDAKYYGTKKERKGFPFVEKRKIFFTISCILLLAVPASMIFMHQTKGSALNFGLDFKGGTSINVPFNEDYSIEELDKEVEPVVEGVTKDSNIQMTKVVGGNNVIIKTRSLTLEEREQVYQAMADNFGVDTSEITFDNISSTVSKEMSQNAMNGLIHCFLDNDKAGMEAVQELREEYGLRIRDASHIYGGYNDLNDFLRSKQNEQPERQQEKPERKGKGFRM